MNKVLTTTGEEVILSEQDYLSLKDATFYFTKCTGYVQVLIQGRPYHLQRYIMAVGPEDKQVVDHINQNPLDNRRENLRLVSHSQNHHNAKTRPSAGVEKRGHRYRAHINILGTKTNLGTFATFEEAKAVYLSKKKELSGL